MQEEFLKLPWNDRETDEVYETADEAYFKAHSSTYKILRGTLQKVFSSDSESETLKNPGNLNDQFNTENKKVSKGYYIPGFFDESKIKYPRKSTLNKEQQVLYLQLMLKCGNKHSHTLTESELKQYEILHDKVSKERYDFIQFVRQRCALSQDRYLYLHPDIKKYIEELWEHKLSEIAHYPACYESVHMLPLVYSDTRRPVVMKMEKTLLQLGCVPYAVWPKFKNRLSVHINYGLMKMKFPPDGKDPDHPDLKLHKEQVSEDKNAERLALLNEADIVISPSALKKIADNHGPSFEKNWDIPVIVRDCIDPNTGTSRRVVFVDKPLPPNSLTIAEKNLWCYKIGVKPVICHKKHNKVLRLEGVQKSMSDASSLETEETEIEVESTSKSLKRKRENFERMDSTDDERKLIINNSDSDRSPVQSRVTRSRSRTKSLSDNQEYKKSHVNESLKDLNISDKCKLESEVTNSEWTLPPEGSNVYYRLWKLHKENLNNADMKGNFLKGDNTNREIKVLIRCKVDGYEKSIGTVHVVPKMEYQTEYGAECVTRSEITQQWMSLFVRPDAVLCRTRINVCTSEVIMVEKRSLHDVAQENVHHFNSPVSLVLGTVYNILLGVVDLEKGSYILSHTPRLGAFVNLRYSLENGRYNLHDMYKVDPSTESTNEKFLWNPIDNTIITPYQQAMNRVPGTYPPVIYVAGKPYKRNKGKKKRKNIVNEQKEQEK